ncbi:hypothetical protein ATO7_05865 [Oceanococcus atlanticus]|uniref:Uncharacterized protein n=1 Tax=Oceanococcus atlanticus TaxID=1317117 RepID=A0A1Y1SI70_9GAMM|nr:hypothetical protein [Oceanococcus atlanticus]ORE89382.1 hypothetical protein ATO7_05865 [Oceanococcus atlanticus]
MFRTLQTLLILLLLPSAAAAVSQARQECESWARNDGIGQMKWDAYVNACVQSMTGEGESAPLEPDPTPPPAPSQAPDWRPAGSDE